MNAKTLLNRYLKRILNIWFIPATAFVWVLGPRRFSFRSCALITVVIVAVWLIYLLIKWLYTRSRRQKIEKKAPDSVILFEERLVKAVKGRKDSPWYLVIGPLGSGKTSLLKNSTLDFFIDTLQEKPDKQIIEATKNFDLFYTKEAVILDTTGRYVTSGNIAQVNSEWLSSLFILKKHRRKRPIDGLIVTIDVPRLLESTEKAIQEAKVIRERIEGIISSLGITFPVYLVFTKCDFIYGFKQFFDDLPSPKQMWGVTLRKDQQENPDAAFKEECKGLLNVLNERRLVRLASAGREDRNAVYTFPLEFADVYQKLSPFIETLFPPISGKEKPMFRGFYFTSATQDGTPTVDFVMRRLAESFNRKPIQLPAQRAAGEARGYFIRDLFDKVIFRDRGLHRPTALEKRRTVLMRLAFYGLLTAVIAGLIAIYSISYFRNKHLMADTEKAAVAVGGMREDALNKDEYFERLRKLIIRLEKFDFFLHPWHEERNEVANAARSQYLLKKYGSSSGWDSKLRRRIEISVKVFKSETDELKPIKKVIVRAYIGGKQYKKMRTNRRGAASFRTQIEDGKASIRFAITEVPKGETEGYEIPGDFICEVLPGEVSKKVQFVFSKLARVINIECIDQFGQKLSGVPISIYDSNNAEKAKGSSNEQGGAQLRLEATDGTVLIINCGDSPTNYPAKSETIIQSGQFSYSIQANLRRKIEITIMALDGSVPKPGVSVSLGGVTLGRTGPGGDLKVTSDTIPTENIITASPNPQKVIVEKTATGYSIALIYGSGAAIIPEPVTPPRQTGPSRQPEPPARFLRCVNESQQPISNVEAWIYLREGETNQFNTVDEMVFESDGKRSRLVKLGSTTDNKGSLKLPDAAEGHQILLYNPDFWSQKLQWQQTAQPIQMMGIRQKRSLQDFDKVQRDGAEYFYKIGQRYYNQGRTSETVKQYENAVRLVPRLKYQLKLGWAYYESNQLDSARKRVNIALDLKFDDPEANEELLKQQLRELQNLLR